MIENFGPVILIELVLVFGGILLFAWWQFRYLRKEREKARKEKSPVYRGFAVINGGDEKTGSTGKTRLLDG